MISTATLFQSVLVLFLLIIPGFLLKKCKLIGDSAAKAFTNTILYATQPALLIVSFIKPFDKRILFNSIGVLVFSFIAHILFYFVSVFLFKNAEKERRKVLRFSIIFSNAGYMGIPLIMQILGDEAAIYASFYNIGFNVFAWSLGFLIYSENKKYISPKKVLFNAATIPIFIGIMIFITQTESYIPDVLVNVLEILKNTVAPMSMMLIGMRLSDVKLSGCFNDKNLYKCISLRLVILPILFWSLMKLLAITGIYNNILVFTISLVLASTPTAAMAGMLAEKFDSDSAYASKIVSISTILSLATMPFIALLLKI